MIGDVITGLSSAFPNVVVVDDGSSADTAAVLKGLPVLVVRHQINLGQGASLQTGITFALERGANYIVTFDADGQHRAEDALERIADARRRAMRRRVRIALSRNHEQRSARTKDHPQDYRRAGERFLK